MRVFRISSATDSTTPTAIATILTPLERVHVDSATRGAYKLLHRSSIDEVVQDLREQRANAVLVSVARYDPASTARMAAMVREFPRIPAFALLTDVYRSTPHSVLSLGQLGVRTLIDTRQPSGWSVLKDLLVAERATDIAHLTLVTLNLDLTAVPDDCWRVFELIFTHRPSIVNVRRLARLLNVLPTTLISRFYRAGLPSPKRYIDLGRLIRAARMLENPGLSVSAVARQLEYSSPQAFSRHVRALMQMSPVQFRRTYTGESMLRFFREELILPHVHTLRMFHPVEGPPGWTEPGTGLTASGE